MGMTQSINKVNFEDVQYAVKHKNYLLINTLSKDEQNILIHGTVSYHKEESIINEYLKTPNINIIIYDKNASENRPFEKYNQLTKLGFTNVYIYPGGLFEWLLLQDIYSEENFPTTSKEMDILKYKGVSKFNVFMLNDIN
tara:strand:+ start:811 stop:1230 length:420 start_codon:yes stop_codon:yes gene_type:complete